jgi:hypothetical protein
MVKLADSVVFVEFGHDDFSNDDRTQGIETIFMFYMMAFMKNEILAN